MSGITQTGVSLTWNAATDNVGVTGYALYLNGTKVGTTTQTSYSFSGLSCGTSYTLAVAAYDAAGNVSATGTSTPTTSACSDTTRPTVPGSLSVTGTTQTGISVAWSAATDNVAVTGYALYLNGTKVGTTAQTSYSFSGLSCGTSYTLGVAAYDAAGNLSSTASTVAAASACPDNTAPTAPTGVAVTATTQTGVSLVWNAATDNVGVTGYALYVNGTKVGTTAQTSYSFSGLSCGTSYTLGVAAYDAAGNLSSTPTVTAATYSCVASGPCGSAAASAPATLQHVVWIWMENQTYSNVIGNTSAAPYENQLAGQCGLATNYAGVSHPSLPNYIAATSGSTQGITDDNPPSSHPLGVASIFGQINSKSYQESMPSNCALTSSGNYAVKHNPEAYYTPVRTDCNVNDVPMGSTSSGAFLNDLTNNTLPAFSFVTPDMCNDTHDCSVSTGDTWLKSWVPKIIASPAYQAGQLALFITWDENDGSTGNQVPAIVASPYTPAGTTSATSFNHYSLLRTTEELLGTTNYLGNAAGAASMRNAFFSPSLAPPLLSPPPPPPPPPPPSPASTSTLGSSLPTRLADSAGTVYYVATTGSDQNPGTATQPWRTVQHATDTLQPGQTAKIEPGTYAENVIVTSACAATCTIEAADPNNKPSIASLRLGSASFWRFRNLIFDGRILGGIEYAAKVTCSPCSSGDSSPGSHDVEFYGDQFEYANSGTPQGLLITSQNTNIQVYNSRANNNGTAFPNTNHSQGFYVQNCSACVFANDIADHNEAKGFQLYNGGTAMSLRNSFIVNNLAYANKRMGFIIDNDNFAIASANMVGGNQIRNNLSVGNGSNGGSGFYSQFSGMCCPSDASNTLNTNLAWSNGDGDLYNGDGSLVSTIVSNLAHADPLFTNPAANDFQLLPGSPAIGAAVAGYTPPFDFDGHPRVTANLGPY